jgi:dTMP kinase
MLIAIEGVDKSGKETQTSMLLDRLRKEGRNARKVEFPNYASEAAGAVKMYLNGEFGESPDDVNPYAASILFTVDRYASYIKDWRSFLGSGGIVVADRYTMSNMIHQGAKFSDPLQRRVYIDWLIDFEFGKIGLPSPDIVIFLDLPMDLRIGLMEKKMGESGLGPHSADIHERDLEYLNRSNVCAREIAATLGWTRVDAGRGGALRTAADIHEELYSTVAPLIQLHT